MSDLVFVVGLCIIVGLATAFSTTRTITAEQVSKAFAVCENNIGFDSAEIWDEHVTIKCINGAEFKLGEVGK